MCIYEQNQNTKYNKQEKKENNTKFHDDTHLYS